MQPKSGPLVRMTGIILRGIIKWWYVIGKLATLQTFHSKGNQFVSCLLLGSQTPRKERYSLLLGQSPAEVRNRGWILWPHSRWNILQNIQKENQLWGCCLSWAIFGIDCLGREWIPSYPFKNDESSSYPIKLRTFWPAVRHNVHAIQDRLWFSF